MTGKQVVATTVGTVTVALAAGLLAYSFLSGLSNILFDYFFYQTTLFGLTLGLVAIAAARAGTLNLGVWITSVAGLLMTLESTTLAVANTMLSDQVVFEALLNSLLAPADLPRDVAVVLILERGWLASLGGFLTLGLLLFPDGHLPSRRWRIVAATSVVGIGLFTSGNIIAGLPSSTIPWESPDTGTGLVSALMELGLVLVGISILASLASLFARYRKSGTEKRHQIRWMLFGASVFALSFIVAFAVSTTAGNPTAANYATLLAMPLLVGAYGVGIVRYRLYDIDVVINRSLVFGALALFITGVYVAIVVGLGNLIGDPSNLGVAIAATALVAVVFEPVRARVQHWANVVVYGRRATPYEVLAGMSAATGTPEEQLSEATRLLAEGTGAENVAIWNADETEAAPVAASPMDVIPARDDGWDLEVLMFHEEEEVGTVTLRKRRGDQVSPQDERLVVEFAGQASLVVANTLLNQRLRQRLDELTESRRRLVSTQDETRRRLERDLHDGAQQQLVALKVKLGMAKTMAGREDAPTVVSTLEGISHDADSAVDTLRDLARGIYPPLLEAEGLATAIEAQANKAPLAVSVSADDVGRYLREVEAQVYFCVLEALNNAVKYAGAESVQIILEDTGGALTFSVTDDGAGFDPAEVSGGPGLQGMADRIDTIGGELHVEAASGKGTTVRAKIPAKIQEVAGAH
ncbi:hypothetical protein BH23ACT4_BH23ACT4_05170 [soil metagenome]